MNVLLSDQISKSSAEQRAGRAGRTTSGICVRLWSKSFHDRMLEFEIPEILRIDLSEVLLNLKAVGLKLMDL